MSTTQSEQAAKIDALMEQASQALVRRDYFEAERLAASALRRAHHVADYDRMARILMPLQEARRQKRDMAVESGRTAMVEGELPQGRGLAAGCYLLAPPRVGVDGRMLRDMADEKRVPVVVIVREPTSRDGLWPIVAVGPVTVRTKVPPPAPRAPRAAKRPGRVKTTPKPGAPAAPAAPEPEWFLEACEALGNEAVAQVPATLPAQSRVDALLERLEAHPDHEKLHQRLEDACREASREPPRKRKPGFDEEFVEDVAGIDEEEEDIV